MAAKKGLFGLLNLESIVDHLYGFIDSKIELVKIETKAEIAKVVSRALIIGFVALLSLFFLLFISLYVAARINQLYPDEGRGYLYVSLFYLIVASLIIIIGKIWKLDEKLQTVFIKLIDKKDE